MTESLARSIRVCARSECGVVRDENQDSLCLGAPTSAVTVRADGSVYTVEGLPLLGVFDGLGGAAAGAAASELAADFIWRRIAASAPTRTESCAEVVNRALVDANAEIHSRGAIDPLLYGMGTTASVAVIFGDDLICGQVGDSRVYLFRGGNLIRVTQDHSLAAAKVALGRITEAQARTSNDRHLVLQALGVLPTVEVSVSAVALRRGDRLLLCTDGLHSVVPDHVIAHALDYADIGLTAARLIALVEQAGAPDNVTVIVADMDAGFPSPEDPVGGPGQVEEELRSRMVLPGHRPSRVVERLAERAGLREPRFRRHADALVSLIQTPPARIAAVVLTFVIVAVYLCC